MWKGKKAKYYAIHRWIERRKIKPKFCEECHKMKILELSNISGKYKREIDDYRWLCRSCHRIYDNKIFGRNEFKIINKFGENF